MKIYMKTTTDKFELPEYIADSVQELADQVGLKKASVASMISKGLGGYCRVVVEDEPKKWPTNDGGIWYYDKYGHVVIED